MTNLALIVEDDPKLAAIFAEALRAAEFETEVISDGRKALDRLDESVVANLVVLDLHLPHVSGRDILQAIRANERYNQSRVILATADPLLAEELRPNADLVLLKPISFIQLRDLASRLRPQK
jgi:DNA-binding response OmpR family regulator